MENFNIIGQIEVILEDKHGNVKRQESAKNFVSEAFKRYVFYDFFNHGTLGALLQANTTQNLTGKYARFVPSGYVITALKNKIDIDSNTYLPPYINEKNFCQYNDKIAFMGDEASVAESGIIMTPFRDRCYFSSDQRELVLEFRKNTGIGTINSVVIGRKATETTIDAHKTAYRTVLRDGKAPFDWATKYTGINHVTEHLGEGGSIIYKYLLNTEVASFNTLTKEFRRYGNHTTMQTNIATLFNGLVIGDTLFRADMEATTAPNYTIRLRYIKNWRETTTIQQIQLKYENTSGLPQLTNQPVMVYNHEIGKIEIFQTVSIGVHTKDDNKLGCHIIKFIVDPVTFESTVVDLGIQPYGISNPPIAPIVHQYLSGYYLNGKYYLPITNISSLNFNNLVTYAADAFTEGVIVDEDLKFIDSFNFMNNALHTTIPVLTEIGVLPCRTYDTGCPYVYQSQIVSALNLDNPITKNEEDVLRVIYHYKLG